MFSIIQILTVLAIAVAMALALAHALELPGKMRLSKDIYCAMQPIYYPGFTIAGISEPAGIVLTIVLLFLTPSRSANFWLTLVALLGLIGMQAVYWLFTHPAKKFWLEDEKLSSVGSSFFAFGANREDTRSVNWVMLRNPWEYSHVARAELGLTSLFALIIAISCLLE
jgi:hypothetical protein